MTSDEELSIPEKSFKYNLPPEDVTFSSLYVMKNDLVFSNEESFISLPKLYKDDNEPQAKQPRHSGQIRYMAANIKVMKSNPNKKQDKKGKGNAGNLPKFQKKKFKPN